MASLTVSILILYNDTTDKLASQILQPSADFNLSQKEHKRKEKGDQSKQGIGQPDLRHPRLDPAAKRVRARKRSAVDPNGPFHACDQDRSDPAARIAGQETATAGGKIDRHLPNKIITLRAVLRLANPADHNRLPAKGAAAGAGAQRIHGPAKRLQDSV
jgi:hypothetical protein